MFKVNHGYISQLEHPQEAITEELWRTWRSELLNKSITSTNYKTLLDLDIKSVATNCGVLWKSESGESIGEILQKDFFDIKNRKHIGEWIKKATTLTICKLIEFSEEEIEKVITLPPTEKELKQMELQEEYNIARIKINKLVDTSKKELTNENYELLFRGLVELCLRTFAVLGELNEEKAQKYIPITFDRLVNNMKIKDICDKYDAQHGFINNILNKIGESFRSNVMGTEHNLMAFDRKFMMFYENAYETLNNNDKSEWARRLQPMKNFRKYFIGINLEA